MTHPPKYMREKCIRVLTNMNERETNALERVKRKERERITRTSAENDIDI